VAATPLAVVRSELDLVRDGRPLPAVLRPLYDNPAAQLPAVVEALRRYWEATVEPVWPRLRAVGAADLAHRMERFADGGLVRVLADLHPDVTLEGGRLQVDKPKHCSHRFDLAGTGIVLLPSAFIWPTVMVECCDVDQPTITYPARGVAELWQEAPAEQTDPLSALVGRTRATLLATLGLPRTTTQLAVQLGLGPPAVSQHLKGPEGHRAGQRPPPRPDGALPTHPGRDGAAERDPVQRGDRLSGRPPHRPVDAIGLRRASRAARKAAPSRTTPSRPSAAAATPRSEGARPATVCSRLTATSAT
jgi:Family of unknown function (DUF5937)